MYWNLWQSSRTVKEMEQHDDGLKPSSAVFFFNEVRRPHQIRTWTHAPWLAVAAVCLGALMSQVDASIVTLAYPTLQHSFGVSVGAVTWVGLAYLLTVVSTLVVFGRVSDMAGRKLIYVYGFVVFLLGSLLCGTAPTLSVLIASRVLQAVGGAMIQANSVAIVVLALPLAKRTKGLGFQAAAQALGLAVGPTLGGLLLGVVSWRWLFLVNIPVGLVALPASIAFIPRSRHLAERRPLDWSGAGLLFVLVCSFLGALSFAGKLGWGSPYILGGFVVAIVATIVLSVHERRTTDPLISPALLARSAVGGGMAAASLGYLSLFALLLLVPFEIERGFGAGPSTAGLVLLALPLAIGITAPLAGRVTTTLGTSWAAFGSALVAALGTLVVAMGSTSQTLLIVGLGITGVGLGVFNTVNNSKVMAAIPTTQAGVGSGMLNTTRGFGTALGLAGGGAAFVAFGGSSEMSTLVEHAFRSSVLCLAGVLVIAGMTGGLAARGPSPLRSSTRLGA
jgi:EmrB/QacA subfamily drug resistance transporter